MASPVPPTDENESIGGQPAPPTDATPTGPGLAVVAAFLFVLALGVPALGSCLDSGSGKVDWISNRDVVLAGPLAPFFFEVGWYANIPFAIGIVALLRGRRLPVWLIVVQVLLVLASLLPVPLLGAGEAPAHLCRWGLGYWMWFAAQATIVAASLDQRRRRSHRY